MFMSFLNCLLAYLSFPKSPTFFPVYEKPRFGGLFGILEVRNFVLSKELNEQTLMT